MRRLIFAALPFILPLAACGNADAPGIPGSGSGPARSYQVADFDQVEATGPDDVAVSTGTGFSVRAEGDPGVLDKLRIEKHGSTLLIGRRSGFGLSLRGAKVFVTLPRLLAARLTGSGDLGVDHIDGDRFEGAATGSGDLTVHALKAKAVSLTLTGSGKVTAAGEARSLRASLAGSGDLDAQHLGVAQADIDVAGSGNLRARVKGAAQVTLAGSGDVDLGDAARCTISKVGSGSVRCGG